MMRNIYYAVKTAKSVYLSLLIIAAVVSLTVGAAYAYFTSNTVSMTGITLATGGPLLKISLDGQAWADTVAGTSYANIYPGWVSSENTFWFKNQSGNGAPIAQIIPTISLHENDWDILKDVLEACFKETSAPSGCASDGTTDWKTLNVWSTNTSTGILLTTLTDNTSRQMSLKYRMVTSATDSAKNKTINNLKWDFTGRTN